VASSAKAKTIGSAAYPDFSTKEKAQALVKAFAGGKPPKLLDAK
jgi:hypothetical protein